MNIAVFGAKGRVGSKVVEIALKRNHKVYQIDKNFEHNKLDKVDAVIDFSTASATSDVCAFCSAHKCPLISGVTGHNTEQLTDLEELSKQVKVIKKENFSTGVTFLKEIAELAASELKNWDCAIIETHRKGKTDSPSGTAKALASIISQNKGSFSTVTVHSVRAGSNFGKHEIIFAADGESITVTHQAENVEIFALGAVKEAENMLKQY